MPLISLGIFYKPEWFPNITAMVDSGAVYSTFVPETAKHIGLNYKSGKEMKFKFGDISTVGHRLKIQD